MLVAEFFQFDLLSCNYGDAPHVCLTVGFEAPSQLVSARLGSLATELLRAHLEMPRRCCAT
jgi:hypothetical protein